MDRRDPQQPDRRQLPRPGGRRDTDPPSEWLTIRRYALTYGANRKTVFKWLDQGLLEWYRVGFFLRVKNQPPATTALPDKGRQAQSSVPTSPK